jgi:hypothetical protein
MSNDISPTPVSGGAVVEDGKKKTNVNHEEFGETEMDDLRKVGDEQRIEVTPEEVGSSCSQGWKVTTLTRTG